MVTGECMMVPGRPSVRALSVFVTKLVLVRSHAHGPLSMGPAMNDRQCLSHKLTNALLRTLHSAPCTPHPPSQHLTCEPRPLQQSSDFNDFICSLVPSSTNEMVLPSQDEAKTDEASDLLTTENPMLRESMSQSLRVRPPNPHASHRLPPASSPCCRVCHSPTFAPLPLPYLRPSATPFVTAATAPNES